MNTAAVRANRRKLLILAAIVLLCAAGYMLVEVNFSNPKLLAYAMTFTHTFYDKKPENALLYIKPEYPTKKEYIADNKHVIQKYASKRSEGMRD